MYFKRKSSITIFKFSTIKNYQYQYLNKMRRPTPLTSTQKRFIKTNRKKMSVQQISDQLGENSSFRVYSFCKENNLKRRSQDLNNRQKKFVRKYFTLMKESCLLRALKITKYRLKLFCLSEGLTRQAKAKEAIVSKKIFVIERMKNWVA